MVKKNNIIPKENLAQVEEVRELENKSQEQEPTITESIKEAVLPTVHASDEDERAKKAVAKAALGAEAGIIGAVCPPAGAAIAVGGGLTGKAMKSAGNDTNNEDLKEAGEIVETGTEIGGVVGGVAGKAAEATVDTITAPVKLMQEIAKNV